MQILKRIVIIMIIIVMITMIVMITTIIIMVISHYALQLHIPLPSSSSLSLFPHAASEVI